MTYSNNTLARRFRNGESTGQSANMEIEQDSDGFSVVWGYEWAVYALRTPNGKTYAFDGWSDYSKSTNLHISLLNCRQTTAINQRPESIDEARELISLTA